MPRIRFTTRSLAIAIALIGLNLAAGIATRRNHRDATASAAAFADNDHLGPGKPLSVEPDGAIHLRASKHLETGETLEYLIWPLTPPGPLAIASPAIAGLSITLLALTVCVRWNPARRSTIAIALFGLVLASASHRPPSTFAGERPSFESTFLLHSAGRPDHRATFLSDPAGFVIVRSDGRTSRPRRDRPADHVLETIVYQPDGSIVAYEGNPNVLTRLWTWPEVLREPRRSRLEMWWPALATAAIACLVFSIPRPANARPRLTPDRP